MITSRRPRGLMAFMIVACLVACPSAAFAKKGEKNYKLGIAHEQAQQWEKAAQEFALAVAAAPSDTEYQLHYRRAVFNASQVYMLKGKALAEQGDYAGGYNAFRQAYGYDPVNEVAAQEMARALRLAGERDDNAKKGTERARAVLPHRGSYLKAGGGKQEQQSRLPESHERLRAINYKGDLKDFIKMLAREVGLNVIFDRQTFNAARVIEVSLQDVTAARALDYIFLQEGLFFQQVDRGTILVADQSRRPQYQQLVIRTFYLANADPADAHKLIQQAMPPQQGRQASVITNKSTNSVTVRDTPENMRLIGEILRTIDKDRAEVVMDVKIYEVSRTDLLQFGNQFGTESALTSLGGTNSLTVLGGGAQAATGSATALGAALVIPTSSISALQRKDRSRLLASTQVHAFDGEKSEAHIGQRVPVQTAQVNSTTGTTTTSSGTDAYTVIQYEATGLTLEFTPQVFPNRDVQVKMSIKSNDVTSSSLTPTFIERRLSGTARIQNNRTMMIASVSQNQQSSTKTGLPLLGLIPVLGRLFTAPRDNNNQTDIVVAVTPHVLRAPEITPDDEESHPSGSMQSPQAESLEAMLRQENGGDQFAAARDTSTPSSQEESAPEAAPVSYVPAPKAFAVAGGEALAAVAPSATQAALESRQTVERAAVITSVTNDAGLAPPAPVTEGSINARAVDLVELVLATERSELSVGGRQRVAVRLKGDAALQSVQLVLCFDASILRVVGVTPGDMINTGGGAAVTASVDPRGTVVFIAEAPGASKSEAPEGGTLFFVEVEGVSAGAGDLWLDGKALRLTSDGGRVVPVGVGRSRVLVKP